MNRTRPLSFIQRKPVCLAVWETNYVVFQPLGKASLQTHSTHISNWHFLNPISVLQAFYSLHFLHTGCFQPIEFCSRGGGKTNIYKQIQTNRHTHTLLKKYFSKPGTPTASQSCGHMPGLKKHEKVLNVKGSAIKLPQSQIYKILQFFISLSS